MAAFPLEKLRWILYDTTHGLLFPTGEAVKTRDLMFDDGYCVYMRRHGPVKAI